MTVHMALVKAAIQGHSFEAGRFPCRTLCPLILGGQVRYADWINTTGT